MRLVNSSRSAISEARNDSRPARFPLILGADLAGIVEAAGEGAAKFAPGEEVFGQLSPFGTTGTYAERVAVSEEAPFTRVPRGLDPIIAAALPTAGGAALAIVEALEPLSGKTLLLVGAAGGIGSMVASIFGLLRVLRKAGAVVVDRRGSCPIRATTDAPDPRLDRRNRER
jgi:NADPH:quinone reductase-like Zn-dependent oxidoreductase